MLRHIISRTSSTAIAAMPLPYVVIDFKNLAVQNIAGRRCEVRFCSSGGQCTEYVGGMIQCDTVAVI